MKDAIVSKFQLPCLLYDESCPLCLRFKQSLERTKLDTDLYYYPIQNKYLYTTFPMIKEDEVSKEVHLILSQTQHLKGPEVITYLAKQNSSILKFSWLIESKMGQKAIDIFYKTSNKYRETLRKRCHKCNH
jgi:predicted DCC family thiol-disulfide oxidoreductase YuxK